MKALITKDNLNKISVDSDWFVVCAFPGDEYSGRDKNDINTVNSIDGFWWWVLSRDQVQNILPTNNKETVVCRSPFGSKKETEEAIKKLRKTQIKVKFPSI